MTGLSSGQLGVVLAHVDKRTARWRNKCDVLQVLGRWDGDPYPISRDDLSVATLIGYEQVGDLLLELAAARVILLVEQHAGSRPDVWQVNPNLAQWRGVPWKAEVAASEVGWRGMLLTVFHEEQPTWSGPGLRAAGARRPRTSGSSARDTAVDRAQPDGVRGLQPPAARKRNVVRGKSRIHRAQMAAIAQEEVPPTSGATSPPPVWRFQEVDRIHGEGTWRRAKALVLEAAADPSPGRRAFLNDRTEVADRLAAVVLEAGLDGLAGWLIESPTDHQVPRLVDWLEVRQHAPAADVAEALANRASTAPEPAPVPAGGPEPPRLAEFHPKAPAGPTADHRAHLDAIRGRTVPNPSPANAGGTMTAEEALEPCP